MLWPLLLSCCLSPDELQPRPHGECGFLSGSPPLFHLAPLGRSGQIQGKPGGKDKGRGIRKEKHQLHQQNHSSLNTREQWGKWLLMYQCHRTLCSTKFLKSGINNDLFICTKIKINQKYLNTIYTSLRIKTNSSQNENSCKYKEIKFCSPVFWQWYFGNS